MRQPTPKPRPGAAVLPVDPGDRDAEFWRLTAAGRVAVMRAGELTLAECCRRAARAPHEAPLLHGEFEFIAHLTPEAAEGID
jgi:hypothetical protein